MDNFFQLTSDASTKTVEKIRNGIQKYLIFIVLLFNISLEVLGRLYKFGFNNTFTAEFFVNFIISTATSMLCYICFIPFGRSDELKRSTTYRENLDRWHKLTDTIRAGYLNLFRTFCLEQIETEKEENKKVLLCNGTIIDYKTYTEQYEGKSKEELKKLAEQGEISKDELKVLIKCNKVKVKPINPLIVLQGARKTTVNDAGRDDSSYALSKTLQRPLLMFTTSFIINTFSTTFIGGAENVLLDIMLSVFSIVIASVCGYTTGVNDFKYKEDRIKSRVVFMSLFCETNKISVA